MQTKRALVLGGGGVTGIAWEIGVLAGLQRGGVDVAAADVVIGTSAGSVVGSLLALGVPLDAAVASQRAPDRASTDARRFDIGAVMNAFALLFDDSIDAADARVRVGAMALAASTGDEASYLARFSGRVPEGTTWPTKPRLVITGVDAVSGVPIAWDADAGVSLLRAIAASCAVPCIFPPVTIGDRRYMDGGVRNHANVDLAAGALHVIVVAPMAGMAPPAPALYAALGDAKVLTIEPDDDARNAIGPNVMDASRRNDAVDAGLAQGAALSAEALRAWS